MPNLPSALNADELKDVSFINGLNADGTLASSSYWSSIDHESAHKWGGGAAGTPGGTVDYAFDPASNWSAPEQAMFKAALALWSDEANITFTEVASTSQARLVFHRTSSGAADTTNNHGEDATSGSATISAIQSAQVNINTSVKVWQDLGSFTANGGNGPQVIVHELGHALGLGHAGPYNASVDPSTQQYGPYDTRLWSIMSYINPNDTKAEYQGSYPVTGTSWGSSDGYGRQSETPMPLDIAAVQQLYGARVGGALSGGQTFGFNCNIADASRGFFDFTQNTAPVATLYDSGAYNTLDLSGFAQDATVNLSPGAFSSCAGLKNNVGIAYGTRIDGAVGGAGKDTFVLNLDGDTVNGGGGDNTAVLQGSEAQYTYSRASTGVITVTPTAGVLGGVDTLANIQHIQFAGGGAFATADLPFSPASATATKFACKDTATGASEPSAGEAYAGSVNYLQWQYLWAGQDGANVTASVPNVFLRGGSGNDALAAQGGSNVLDGGTGSNFLIGATGVDGGTDTFFVDGHGTGVTWSTAVNFHRGDAATLWGFDGGRSTFSWVASDGAAGFQGATIHAQAAGAGTATNASLTLAGVSLADAQSKFAISTGTAGGEHYMHIAYVG